MLKCFVEVNEGRLSKLQLCRGGEGPGALRLLPESVGECTGLQELDLQGCFGLVSLPERLGDCKGLQKLYLGGCEGLLSLPERLGECTGLQTLSLYKCEGLLSLPDLSGLAQLEVGRLNTYLKPWAASGYKALRWDDGGWW